MFNASINRVACYSPHLLESLVASKKKKKKGESKQKQKITQEQGHGKASKNKRRHGKEASRAWVTDRIQSDRIGKGVGPSGKKKPQKSGTLG